MTATLHPRKNEYGQAVTIGFPSSPTPFDAWTDPASIATVIPQGRAPEAVNGIACRVWQEAPLTDAGWCEAAARGATDFDEPEFVPAPGKRTAAGVVIAEPDGRLWVVHPSNAFGGYPATFPKGTMEPGMPMRATAIREAFEESGLQVVLTGFLADAVRSRSKTRYYLGHRIGGCPADMGWESQAVSLVPRALLHTVLVNPNDAALVAMLQAPGGAAPG
jgi:8-oxo-dGTP pyrophosphatase MutT (NUDIX family)